MPYKSANDKNLPEHVQEMSPAMREHWVGAFNGMYEDCQKEGGDDCEGKAMRGANSAVKQDTEMQAAELSQYTYNGITVQASGRRTSDRDDKKYMRTVKQGDTERVVHYGDPNLPMRRNNDEAQKNFVARHNCSEKTDPFAPGFWACYDWENTSEMADGFLYVDLASLTPGKSFTGFAAGTFTDMRGRKIVLAAKDITTFVTNTLELIGQYKARNMPGLPIDEMSHNKGKAAGWITGAEAGEVQDSAGNNIPVIRLLAEWTKIGVELLKEKIQTNFSPTVDLDNKTIRGGSLTNWPATVDGKGIPLFAAVELSEGVWSLQENPMSKKTTSEKVDDVIETAETETETPPAAILSTEPPAAGQTPDETGNGEIDMTKEEMLEFVRAEMRGELQSALAELLPTKPVDGEGASPRFDILQVLDMAETKEGMVAELKQYMLDQHAAMQQEARREAARQIALVRRESHVAELCHRVVGGTDDHPHGIPVNEQDLKEFLCRLPEADLEFAKKLLTAVHEQGLIPFTELGHGRTLRGTAELQSEYTKLLDGWIKDGNTVAEFFAVNPELGDMAQYNLSKYQEVNK